MKIIKFLSLKSSSVVENNSRIYPFTIISNSIVLDYSYISYLCRINNAEIGKYCSIATGVKMGLGRHPTNFLSTSPLFYSPRNPLKRVIIDRSSFEEYKRIYVGNDVWIGANAVILDGVKIGDGAVIGANSVVIKDVAPFSVVSGVPAVLIKKRFSDSLIDLIIKTKWWDLPINFFESNEVKGIFSKEMDEEGMKQLLTCIQKFYAADMTYLRN